MAIAPRRAGSSALIGPHRAGPRSRTTAEMNVAAFVDPADQARNRRPFH